MVGPKRIVAIGSDATDALAGGSVLVHSVRHPSQGGRTHAAMGKRLSAVERERSTKTTREKAVVASPAGHLRLAAHD
jgi:hypothetical protein